MRPGYAASLWHRTALRVLHYILRCKLPTNVQPDEALKDFISKIHDLDRYVATGLRVGVKSSIWGCTTVKDNITVNHTVLRAITTEASKRGMVITPAKEGSMHVDVPFYISVYRNVAILYRDLTGPAFHSREYRRIFHSAALLEGAAAGLLYLSNWNKVCEKDGTFDRLEVTMRSGVVIGAVFMDPMCGSGTLLCEAALMATHTAPGLLRSDWRLFAWPDFDSEMWSSLVQTAERSRRRWNGRVLGCDIHPIATHLAKKAGESVGMSAWMDVAASNCRSWDPGCSADLVVCNPPWGLKRRSQVPSYDLIPALSESWRAFGKFLWKHCKGEEALQNSISPGAVRLVGGRGYFLCNYPYLYRQMQIHLTERRPLWIGGVHLGFYGAHFDDIGLFKLHERKQMEGLAVDPRSTEERRSEIEEARDVLDVQPDVSIREAEIDRRLPVRKPVYAWKFRKYVSSVNQPQLPTKLKYPKVDVRRPF